VALSEPWCHRCGFPAERDIPSCAHCPPEGIDQVRAPFLFRATARAAVHRLKFGGWRPVAGALADAILTVSPPPDGVITWVPLSRRRLAERGFDQAHVLAEAVGHAASVPVARLLDRLADTPPQAQKGGAERRATMAGAFRGIGRAPPRVFLVDDVLTTGATAGACARALRAAGARAIVVLVAARAVSAPLPARYTRFGLTPGSVVARGTYLR